MVGRKIKNRDVVKLSEVLYAIQDVRSAEELRLWQQDRLYNITQKITGMPGGHGKPTGLEESFAAITEMEDKYREECAKYIRELKEAEEILNGISSRTMRTFVVMRYVLDLSKREIMTRLNMGRWRYDELTKRIEDAEDMKHVVWPEKYR